MTILLSSFKCRRCEFTPRTAQQNIPRGSESPCLKACSALLFYCCSPICLPSFNLATPPDSLNRDREYLMIIALSSQLSESVHHFKSTLFRLLGSWRPSASLMPCAFWVYIIHSWGQSSAFMDWNVIRLRSENATAAMNRKRMDAKLFSRTLKISHHQMYSEVSALYPWGQIFIKICNQEEIRFCTASVANLIWSQWCGIGMVNNKYLYVHNMCSQVDHHSPASGDQAMLRDVLRNITSCILDVS